MAVLGVAPVTVWAITHDMRTLFYFRLDPASGARVRYELKLDETLLCVSDAPVTEDAVMAHPNNAALAAQLDDLTRRGVQFVLENGAVRIIRVPNKEQIIMSFFAPNAPCPYPGCEGLRAEYNKAIADLEKDGPCDDCDKGQVVREFRERVEKLYAKSISNSGGH